jgi:glycosyltransferase involved in cell wall biosynthesis
MALPYFGFHGIFGLATHADRAFTSLARKLVPFGIERRSALGVFHRLCRVACRTPADLTIVHTELGLAIGCELLKAGRKVTADFEDWHSQDLLPAARRSRPLRLLRRIEQTLLLKAIHTTTTSHALASALKAAHGGREPSVITNSFPLQYAPTTHNTSSAPSLLWFSQTVGPGRGLEAFIQCWIHTVSPSRLVLLGEVSEDYKNLLRSLSKAANKPPIEFLAPCPPTALPEVIALHDVGLALEDTNPPSRNLTITNKILQYLNAGLAVVATDTAGHREVLQHKPEVGVLINRDEPSENARLLDKLLTDRNALGAHQAAARELAKQTFCWEREAPKLLALVEKALAS